MAFLPLTDPPDDDAHDGPCLVVAVHHGSNVLVVDDRPPGAAGLFLGTLDGRHCWAIDVADEGDVDTDLFRDLRLQWGALDETVWALAGRAVQLVEWRRTHRFCGRCGTENEPARGERAMRCPRCSLLAFPRLAPAVITLVHDGGDQILLANNKNFGIPMYSLLAGFVEPGETLEEAAYRETLEEVGVAVRDLAYWGSQPWPFPHSLMLGFVAVADPEVPLALQASEIADAKWFPLDDLPMIPPTMSIAGRMIEAWKASRGQV
jgi:NAD+ diphosphatase